MDRLVRASSLALAPTDDGYLAYDVDSGQLHRLNPAAALIVELADGSRSFDQICAEISPLLGQGSEFACRQWMEMAKGNGILNTLAEDAAIPEQRTAESFSDRTPDLRSEGAVLAAFVCQYHATLQNPDDAHSWAALGELAHIVGKRADARDAYERYLELAPGDAEIEHILVSLRDGTPPPRASDLTIRQLYSRFANFYEANMCGELHYAGPDLVAAALAEELGDRSDMEIVDLGCGTGLAGKHLRPRARMLSGVDLSPEMAEKASATGLYDAVEVAELTEWLNRHTNEDFDLAVACDTFIYFGDLRQAIIPAMRRLRSGSCLGFTVEKSAKTPFQLTDSGRYAHTMSHIEEVAREAGLRIIHHQEHILRYEYAEPVVAIVAVLKKP